MHSFRIDKYTDLVAQGASVFQIQEAGRWESFGFLKYISPSIIEV